MSNAPNILDFRFDRYCMKIKIYELALKAYCTIFQHALNSLENWYCFILKNNENYKEKFQRVKKL